MLKYAVVSLMCIFACQVAWAAADEGASMSSDHFRVLDSQHAAFGGTASSSSPSFRLAGTIGDVAIGSSSANSFGLLAGFLYFGAVVSPTPTPTPTSTPTISPPAGGSGGVPGSTPIPIPIQSPLPTCSKSADLNADGRVNLIDFSILAFWWEQPVSPDAPQDLNCDGRITITDFSIMLFFFNG